MNENYNRMYHVLTPELSNMGEEPVIITRKKAKIFGKHRINMWSAGLQSKANTNASRFDVLFIKTKDKKKPVVARARRDGGAYPQRWRIYTDDSCEWVVELKHTEVFYMTVYPPTGCRLTPRHPIWRRNGYVLRMKQKNGVSSHKNLALESLYGNIAFEIAKRSKGRISVLWDSELLDPVICMCLATIVWCHP